MSRRAKTAEQSASMTPARRVRDRVKPAGRRTPGVGNHTISQLVDSSRGMPLDVGTRAEMEAKFGVSFGDVRIHHDEDAAAAARAQGARAFTAGRDIVFNRGLFAPQTSAGKALLAHELAHVAQQSRTTGVRSAAVAEGEAQRAGANAAGGGHMAVQASATPGAVQRQPMTPDERKADLEAELDRNGEELQDFLNLSDDDRKSLLIERDLIKYSLSQLSERAEAAAKAPRAAAPAPTPLPAAAPLPVPPLPEVPSKPFDPFDPNSRCFVMDKSDLRIRPEINLSRMAAIGEPRTQFEARMKEKGEEQGYEPVRDPRFHFPIGYQKTTNAQTEYFDLQGNKQGEYRDYVTKAAENEAARNHTLVFAMLKQRAAEPAAKRPFGPQEKESFEDMVARRAGPYDVWSTSETDEPTSYVEMNTAGWQAYDTEGKFLGWVRGEKPLETPLLDPLDFINFGDIGLKLIGRKTAVGLAEKTIAKDVISDVTRVGEKTAFGDVAKTGVAAGKTAAADTAKLTGKEAATTAAKDAPSAVAKTGAAKDVAKSAGRKSAAAAAKDAPAAVAKKAAVKTAAKDVAKPAGRKSAAAAAKDAPAGVAKKAASKTAAKDVAKSAGRKSAAATAKDAPAAVAKKAAAKTAAKDVAKSAGRKSATAAAKDAPAAVAQKAAAKTTAKDVAKSAGRKTAAAAAKDTPAAVAKKAAGKTAGKAASKVKATNALVSFGRAQRKELIEFWKGKLKRARAPWRKAQYRDYIQRLEKRLRPTWKQSEIEMAYFYNRAIPGREVSFLNKAVAKFMARGSTRPDFVTTAMFEVKNYLVDNATGMIKTLKRQVTARIEQAPGHLNGRSAIIIDLRGQRAGLDVINDLVERVSAETGVRAENIQVVTY